MAGRAALAGLLVVMALGCLAQRAEAVNGGKICKYVDPRELTVLLKENLGLTDTQPLDPTAYFTALNALKNTNGWICAMCVSPGTQRVNVGAIDSGYGQCICDADHGSYSYTVGSNPGKRYSGFGCSKCPNGKRGDKTFTGASDPSKGPYAGTGWSGTKCLTA
ncbi:MAG: hypothetical protein J3K34DRAFT_438033 [Monoraphidium minutum]|nr:MAG: hypothetical protein J3K34DRAFT_438033 [Monoraphidium minutum]